MLVLGMWNGCLLQVVDIAACQIEPGSASRVVLGQESGALMVYDLEGQRLAATVSLHAAYLLLLHACLVFCFACSKDFMKVHTSISNDSILCKRPLTFEVQNHSSFMLSHS